MVDTAASVALNASADATERYDATAAFSESRGIGGLAAELLPSNEIAPVIDHIREMMVEQDMAKAARGNLIVGPWQNRRKQPDRSAQSVIVDDFQLVTQGSYWERPGLLGFDSMRAMVEQTPILNSIVLTRIRQVNRFCRTVSGDSSTGFSIQHVDPNVELDDKQQESVQLLQRFITNCGWETDPRRRKRMRRDNFAQFMAKSVRDTLTMDAAPIETVFKRDRGLGLDGFHAVDGATIRLCTEEGYEGDDEIQAVQVIQGNIRTAYTFDDLVYEVRNPRTDVTACGYGYSETEMLIRIVTYLLNAMTYNGAFFDKNSVPRGMLNLVGNYDKADISAFKRYWNAMLRGAENSHNIPIMVAQDGESKSEFVEIGGQLNEMAFGKWLTFLTAISCAIYGTAPEEISMESFSSDKSDLSGSDTGEKLVSANDKGLRPLMGFYEGVVSDFIIQTFGPNYCFRFVGLDQEDAKTRFESRKLAMTWNEFRAGQQLDAIDGPLGDIPMNQAFIQTWAVENDVGQPEQPEPEGEDFGDPDAAEGDGFGGPADGADPGADPDPGPGAEAPAGEPVDDNDGFGEPVAKALNPADFGLLPIYHIEA